MPAGQWNEYTIRSRETGEVLCQGNRGKCADFIGCSKASIKHMVLKNKTTTRGFFNSRYEVTRGPAKARNRKYYRVYRGGILMVEGSSYECAAYLGLNMNRWYQLVCKCNMGNHPRYTITAELK